ncbi:MAG: hypothetical protein BHW39_05075 [Firmicutes bacterium CAG:552_39_19]|nr:MAG: hypothetical protein BHW39_05075 [Firmicutes bacterium CAG:552_39_19]
MIYLDNSSTSFYKPHEVISSVSATLKNLSANAGRAGHYYAKKAAFALNDTRVKAANLFGFEPQRTIFTYGCTDSLNLAIYGLNIRGNVVTTAFEHNSVLRPLYDLKNSGKISLTIVNPDSEGIITEQAVLDAIDRRTKLVVINAVSNVTGTVLPYKEVYRRLQGTGIIMLTDAAQAVGSIMPSEICGDIIAVAPHKGLHAPQGVGLLMFNEKVELMSLRKGGTGTMSANLTQPNDLPEGLESGTLPLPAIMGLNAAITVYKRSCEKWRKKVETLGRYAFVKLKRCATVYTKNPVAGIIAFNVKNYDSAFTCDALGEKGLCLRCGLHCAPLLHKAYGTIDRGMVRASVGPDNDFKDIDYLVESIKQI